ncbi:hypothetical protein C900_00159 [Fulvivirga imtechensis AK7]|uniref:EpsG family protein n=1 Tax=Fulvivirga imtechensis AK7 TaxID=1237149 RepID=L8JK73_9BACT|nr:EpsG family protein [Fulvivirga imtechensis]ELR68648.1 hypothetical protein C900_00159 [Fulvivirga imtechensis AK7]
MKRYLNKEYLGYSSIGIFFLLVSPILTFPVILFGLIKRYKLALILLGLSFALISYQIIPRSTSDLAQHYKLFEAFTKMSFDEFLIYLQKRPDFLFYYSLFFFSKTGLSPQWFTAAITYITVNNILRVYHFQFKKSSTSVYIFGIIILLLSIQWSLLFSGLRNYLAFSFVVLAIYNGIILKKRFSFWWIILGCMIHYSSIVFIPIYWLLVKNRNKKNTCKAFFLLSIPFVFLSKDMLLQFIQLFPLPESLVFKMNWYLGKDDIIQEAIKASFAARISFFLQFLWVYFAYVYLLLTIRRTSYLRNIIYTIFFLLNIFFAAPDPFNRFCYVARIFFLLLLLFELKYYRDKIPLYMFSMLMLIYGFVDFYITKDVYFWSLFNTDALTTIGILSKDYFIQPVDPVR